MTQEQLLDGTVIVIDKPYQWTSFQVVNKIKSAIRHTYDLKKFKIGHAGTLDPLATGVLLVCVGKATKRIDELQGGEKVYSGTSRNVINFVDTVFSVNRPILISRTLYLCITCFPYWSSLIQEYMVEVESARQADSRSVAEVANGNVHDKYLIIWNCQ